jgi:hypothetical protein
VSDPVDTTAANASIHVASDLTNQLNLSHEGAIKCSEVSVIEQVEFLVKRGIDIVFIIEAKHSTLTTSVERWHGYYQLKSEMMVVLMRNSTSMSTVYGALAS